MDRYSCHRFANQILALLDRIDQPMANRARLMLEALERFADGPLSSPDAGYVSGFFHRFVRLLNRAAEAPGAASELELRDYCEALRRCDLHYGEDEPRSGDATGADRLAQQEEYKTKIKTTILIIEDDYQYAAELRSYLNARRDDHPRFVLDVKTHVRLEKEALSAFRDRLISRVSCLSDEGGLEHLQATIIDHTLGAFTEQPDESRISGVTLGRDIVRLRPGTSLVLLTGGDLLEMLEEAPGLFRWAVSKHDPSRIEWQELLGYLLSQFEGKYETPFWSALRHFASQSILTFHAMPLAHVRSAKRSAVLDDFVNFYGDPYFHAETSATLGPLDNLLHPSGSIRRAQVLAAQSFGSEETLFVTNGTSTANKIVLQAVIRPGDVVLVDRNCHISHHYAMALAGARPIYLEPLESPAGCGISGGIPLQSILDSLGALLHAGTQPAAILLTNCTFDGIICNPERIMFEVGRVLGEKLCNTVFVFDEAWFGFARFHPQFIRYSGMAAAGSLRDANNQEFYRRNLRVYVTQSTHKTLSAFRQGSMIHIVDPLLLKVPEWRARLTEAFLTHTTTSPHSGIIASLDVARRQADLEGCALVDQTLKLANEFRNQFKIGRPCSEVWRSVLGDFAVLEASDLIPQEFEQEFLLDPTKITLHIRTGQSGDDLKKVLLAKYGIQVNKTSHNSVLVMFNIGTTKSAQANLKNALIEIHMSKQAEGSRGSDDALIHPPFSGFWKDASSMTDLQENDLASFFQNVKRWPVEVLPVADLESRVGRHPGSVVSAGFVTPFPPGYPVLVPGQIIIAEVAKFIGALHRLGRTIHGTSDSPEGSALLVFFLPESKKL